MGDATTPTIGLIKPQVGASRSTWGTKWNGNADDLDNYFAYVLNTMAAMEGQIAALQAEIANVAGTPIGAVFPWPNFGNYPPGYVPLEGQAISRAIYWQLFNVIGTIYGAGDGSTTFNLPDFLGVVLTGLDGGTGRLGGLVADYPGAVGGGPYVTLTEDQAPPHNHLGGTDEQGYHQHYYLSAYASGNGGPLAGGVQLDVSPYQALTDVEGGHYHNVWTYYAGGGAGHPNMQSSAVVIWIMRIS